MAKAVHGSSVKYKRKVGAGSIKLLTGVVLIGIECQERVVACSTRMAQG